MLIRLRSNHYALNESTFRKNLSTAPICTCNQNYETIEHFLWECPIYSDERNWLINRLEKEKCCKPFNSINILREPNSIYSNIIIEFINKCNRYI